MTEQRIEICSACARPTGHAGYGEDSIGYVDGTIGPLCDECNSRLRTEIDCENEEVERLRSLITSIDKTLRVPAAEYVPAIRDVFTLIDNAAKGGGV